MTNPTRPLKVFLCHVHGDKDVDKSLYERLVKDGVDAWLAKEKLLQGHSVRIESVDLTRPWQDIENFLVYLVMGDA